MLKKIGLVLFILSFVFYGLILLIPFFPVSGGIRAGIVGFLAVAGEASFWVGGLILGKDLVVKYRNKLNPFRWFRSKPNTADAVQHEKIVQNRE